MQFSFHVVNVPCNEEFYMGVSADFEAFWVDIPDELFPPRLLKILKDTSDYPTKRVTCIAPHKHYEDDTE